MERKVAGLETRAAVRALDVLDRQHPALELGEDAVEIHAPRVVAEDQGVVRLAPRRGSAPPNVRGVQDRGTGVRPAILRLRAAVVLAGMIADARILDREPELVLTAKSLVVVEAVVAGKGRHQVTRIHRAPEPLEPVVLVVEHLHVLYRRATAHAAHRQPVDLVVRSDPRAAVADRHVAKHARVVVIVGGRAAAVDTPRLSRVYAFYVVHARGRVDRCLAQDDHAAPQPPRGRFRGEQDVVRIVHIVGLGREDDGIHRRTVSKDLTAARYYQCRDHTVGVRRTRLDHRAGFDRQRLAILHEHQAREQVRVVRREGHVTHNVRVRDCNNRVGLCFCEDWKKQRYQNCSNGIPPKHTTPP